jgi:hypothetical protein
VEGTHHKHHKLSAFTLFASTCFALHPAKVHKHVLNTLITVIITFGQISHGKMPLESHFQEARAFLVAVLISACDMPEHWYARMFPPANHHSSFCKLTGLTTEELNVVMEASGFVVKCGKNSDAHFQSDAFHSFLQSYSELQSINSSHCKPNALKPHREYWAYLIGLPSGDS